MVKNYMDLSWLKERINARFLRDSGTLDTVPDFIR